MNFKRIMSAIMAGTVIFSALQTSASAENVSNPFNAVSDTNDKIVSGQDLQSIHISDSISTYNSTNDIYSDGTLTLKEQYNGTLIVCSCDQNATEVIIPEELGGKKVTCVGPNAFKDCEKLVSVTIPITVTKIDNSAFINCKSLESVNIPNGVKSILTNAFYNCENLVSVTIPESVKSIYSGAFSNCPKLAEIILDSNNTNYCVENDTLFNKEKTIIIQFAVGNDVEEYTVPSSVKIIQSGAFTKCVGIESIIIPESLTAVDDYAFDGCTNLEKLLYTGTKEQWESVDVGYENDALLNAEIYYNYKPTKQMSNLNTYASNKSITLNWDKEPLADHYTVFMKNNNPNYDVLGKTAENSFVLSNLSANTPYKLRVGAFDKSGIMIACSNFTVYTKSDIPNLQADVYKDFVILNWEKSNSDDYYKVFVLNNEEQTEIDKIENNSITITNLAPETAYTYQVVAYSNDKETAISDITVKTVGTIANLKGTASNNNIILNWDKFNSAEYYRVFVYSTDKKTELAQITNNNYTAINLEPNTEYKFHVEAYNNVNEKTAFSEICLKTLDNIAGLQFEAKKNSVNLKWDKTDLADNYKVFAKNNENWTEIAQIADNNYTVNNLDCDTVYTYRVIAYSNGQEIALSDVTVKTLGEVAGFKGSASKNSIALNWNKNDSADYYKVYVLNGDVFTEIAQTENNSYAATNLSADTSYTYQVVAYSNNKQIAVSDITLRTLGNIANLKGSANNNSVKLTWDKNAGAAYYKVSVKSGTTWKALGQTKNNNYTATNLKTNTSYTFRVAAFDNSNKLLSYSDITVKTQNSTNKITNLKGSSTSNSITLKWDKLSSAAYYKVSVKNGTTWSPLIKTTGNGCTATKLAANTSYTYRVAAFDNSNKLLSYSDITVKTQNSTNKITNLKGSSTSNSITLKWDKLSSAAYYKVSVKNGTAWSPLIKTTGNGCTATKLVANTSYTYRVAAFDKNNKLLVYSDITVKTLSGISNLKGTSTTNSISLTWNKNASVAYYKVSVKNGTAWAPLIKTTGNGCTATKLSANTSYTYRVAAFDKNNKLLAYSDITVKTK